MTLTEAKILLERNRIPYQTAQYENEGTYWRHLSPFCDISQTGMCKVTALVIPSVNGLRHIELQFNRVRGQYEFEDLYFGSYCFEMGDQDPELLPGDILETIGRIVDCKLGFIQITDPKRRKWLGDACYDLTDSDQVFGAPGFREAVKKASGQPSFWAKITGRQRRFEIYTWQTFRTIPD